MRLKAHLLQSSHLLFIALKSATMSEANPYLSAFKGSFLNMLRWPQFEALWDTLRAQSAAGWYVYAIGETPPSQPATAQQMEGFLDRLNELLRREHDEDYCGIVYVDDAAHPTFVKIYDPNNLGVVCGSSAQPPLPGWTFSLIAPCDLPTALPPPANRRRWWQKLFG
jgi:hypothetical protein